MGGTLGGPCEGVPGPLALTFYDPVPTRALPNDDLDLQVVWLHHLRTHGHRRVTPEILAEAWQRHVLFPFDEYAVARRNRAFGLSGPAQGATDNFFGECMGGAIRSEVWACVAPGDPVRAAGFAWADAVVDHAGDGVWAEVFNAALQSAAFVESDRDRLLAIALEQLPDSSPLKAALIDTIQWWAETPDWREVRARVIEKYFTGNFTHVVCNLCFQLIGWFDGGDDFGRAICTAVNCGQDTDCTGATLGALLGILRPDSIPAAWLDPIGEEVVLSAAIVDVPVPRDLSELTDWTMEVADQLRGFAPGLGAIAAHAPADAATSVRSWEARHALVDRAPARLQGGGSEVCSAGGAATTLHGAWFRTPAGRSAGVSHMYEVEFEVTAPVPLKLMVFARSGARAWVDGREVLGYDAATVAADPFAAPSFHRAGVAAVDLPPLVVGAHTLVFALAGAADGSPAEVVWGFADSGSDLWAESVGPVSNVVRR